MEEVGEQEESVEADVSHTAVAEVRFSSLHTLFQIRSYLLATIGESHEPYCGIISKQSDWDRTNHRKSTVGITNQRANNRQIFDMIGRYAGAVNSNVLLQP